MTKHFCDQCGVELYCEEWCAGEFDMLCRRCYDEVRRWVQKAKQSA